MRVPHVNTYHISPRDTYGFLRCLTEFKSSDLEVNKYVSVLHLNETLITIMNPCGKRSWHRQTTIYALILSCITWR